jgi:hypothetical protein
MKERKYKNNIEMISVFTLFFFPVEYRELVRIWVAIISSDFKLTTVGSDH